MCTRGGSKKRLVALLPRKVVLFEGGVRAHLAVLLVVSLTEWKPHGLSAGK